MRILIAEDDRKAAGFLKKGLKEQRCAVDMDYDGEAALFQAQVNEYGLIIPEVMLPAGPVIKSMKIMVFNEKAKLMIRDTGIGIPGKDLPFIFNRFYRVDRSRSRQSEGAGSRKVEKNVPK